MEAPAMRIRLLGGFVIDDGAGAAPALDSARAESLLLYLILHRTSPLSRESVAFTLWPDSSEGQARTNLRHVLHDLRRALPAFASLIDVTPRTVQWRPRIPVWLDLDTFDAALARAGAGGAGAEAALREAVELYRGDLLERSYDDWIVPERDRLRREAVRAFGELVDISLARGDYEQAISDAEGLLRLDPLDEAAYRALMRSHGARGDRVRAMQVYHRCVERLDELLGVPPSAETRLAFEDVVAAGDGRSAVAEADDAVRASGPVLVGRAREWAILTEHWREAAAGRARLTLVTGEAGIGKSRLAAELEAWCAGRGAITASARSYAAEGELPYRPVVSWLRMPAFYQRLAGLARGHLSELARLLPELVAEMPGVASPEPMPGLDQRQRLFEAVARVVLAPGPPVLLVADDIQWCDRETLRLIHFLLRSAPAMPLLVLGTARPEEIDRPHPVSDLVASLRALDQIAEVPLGRLSIAETRTLAERLAGRALLAEEAGQIHVETEGNPLFVVEAVRAGWGGGRAPAGWPTPRVQQVIATRLDQLTAPARELAGLAATVGRAFTAEILVQAGGWSQAEIVASLDELWRRRIIRDEAGDSYDFSHDKIREVAYLDLSPPRRRHAHAAIARALIALHHDDLDAVSGQVATHLDHAGSADEAVGWYQRAAKAALLVTGNYESVRLLQRALALGDTLPATPDRRRRELAILTSLCSSVGWVDGWGSAQLADIQQRAVNLAAALGVDPDPALIRSVAIVSLARRQFDAAADAAAQLAVIAEATDDDMLRVEAAYVAGIFHFWQGDFVAARSDFETAVSRYRPERRREHLHRFEMDPQVVCLSRLANTLWFLGYPAGAARARDAALALGRELGHSYSLSTAYLFSSMLAIDNREPDLARKWFAVLATQFRDFDTPPTRNNGAAIGGYLVVLDGEIESGLARIGEAIAGASEVDQAPGMRSCMWRVMIEACAVAGAVEVGLRTADAALAADDPARLWRAEVHRRRGEFLAALEASPADVEAAFREALQIARRQQATMLELRTATSLLRYRLGSGTGVGEARARLRDVIDRLPERAESADLRDATRLLETLVR